MRRALVVAVLVGVQIASHGSQAPAGNRPVGEHGDADLLVIRGTETFTPSQLASALNRDLHFLRAAYSDLPLKDLLLTLEERLTLGYRWNGFPEAEVTAAYHGETNRVVVTIREGPRYRQGDIHVTAPPEIQTAPIIAALKKTEGGDSDSGVRLPAAERTLPRARKMRERLEKLGLSDFTVDTRVWEPGAPARLNESSWKAYSAGVELGLAAQGYFYPRYRVEVRPNETDKRATLHVSIDDPGERAVAGRIRVNGAERHTAEQIRRFLGLRSGMPLDLRREVDWEKRLAASGRFLQSRVDIYPPIAPGARSEVHVHLTENPVGPPLGEAFNEEERVLLKTGRWLSNWHNGRDELQIEGLIEATSEFPWKITIRMTLSPRRGFALFVAAEHVKGQRRHSLSVLVTEGEFLIVSPEQQSRFQFSYPEEGQATVELDLKADPPEEGDEENLRRHMDFGLGFNNRRRRTDPPLDLSVECPPAVALAEAHREGWEYRLHSDRLLVGGPNVSAEFERKTGRVLRYDRTSRKFGTKTKVRFGPDLFARERRRIEQTAANLPNGYNPDAPLTSFALFALREAEAITPPAGGLQGQQRSAWSMTRSLVKKGALTPVEELLESVLEDRNKESDEPFRIPDSGTGSSGFGRRLIVEFALPVYLDLFPRESAPWVAGREAALLISGDAPFFRREMEKLLASERPGPLSDLSTAFLLKHVNPALARAFARRGLTRLEPADFRRDYRLLLEHDCVLGKLLRSTAGAVRKSADSLSDDEVRLTVGALLGQLDPAYRQSTTAAVMQLRQHAETPPDAALEAALDALWENGLNEVVEDALQSLANKARMDRHRPALGAVPAGDLISDGSIGPGEPSNAGQR